MLKESAHNELLNPETGETVFKIERINQESFTDFQRIPLYLLIWVTDGIAHINNSINAPDKD